MEKYIEILKKCPLFIGLEKNELLHLLSCLGTRVEHYEKKCTVFAEGSRAKYMGVLLSGAVETQKLDYNGNRNIINSIKPSEVFAEAFACAESDSLPIAVVANEDSDVMLIEASHVLMTCEKNCIFHRTLIFNLMRDLAEKTVIFHQRAEITSKRTTREKLLAYLRFQVKECGKSEFDIPFDRQQLADYLEVDRSGLSCEIGKLKREGLIDNRKSHFIML